MLLPGYPYILANLLLTTCHAGVLPPASHPNNPLHPPPPLLLPLPSSMAIIPFPTPTFLRPSPLPSKSPIPKPFPSSISRPLPSATSKPLRGRPLGSSSAPVNEVPRLVIYFQTTHDSRTGAPISMLPLITEKRIALTHLIVCSFHVNTNGTIHLNDYPPHHPIFSTLWNETQILKTAGVKVLGMVGGAAAGSFSTQTLDHPLDNSTEFKTAYALLHDAIKRYQLDGMDLDVEQPMSLRGIMRLIRYLRRDFGPDFIITLAPVASALREGGANLSGFKYSELERVSGDNIAFYNAQFYNGFGDMSSARSYESTVMQGSWNPLKVLAGQITSPENGGQWVDFATLNNTVRALRSSLGEIGGIMGWEYFNGTPGGPKEPWRWAQEMTAILRPGLGRDLRVTRGDATGLVAAWGESVRGARGGGINGLVVGGEGEIGEEELRPDVDYFGMVNA